MKHARHLQQGIAAAAFLLTGARVDAHIVGSRLGDFYSGALHPLTDLQDVVLWTALGVLAGSLGASRGRWLVLLVPFGLLAGLALGLELGTGLIGPLPNAALMLMIGLLLAARVQLPPNGLCALALALAVLRGMVNATGIGPETQRVLFAAGLASAGYVVITLVMALTLAFRGSDTQSAATWRGIAIRVCGSWIAAIGLMMGAFALAH